MKLTCTTRDELLKLLVDIEDDEICSTGVEDVLLVKIPHVVGHVTLDAKRVLWLSLGDRHFDGMKLSRKESQISSKLYSNLDSWIQLQ